MEQAGSTVGSTTVLQEGKLHQTHRHVVVAWDVVCLHKPNHLHARPGGERGGSMPPLDVDGCRQREAGSELRTIQAH
jgi:hypothetical protein